MKQFKNITSKEGRKTTLLGIALMAFSAILLYTDTKVDINQTFVGCVFICGFLIIFAKDKLIDAIIHRIKNQGDTTDGDTEA